MVSQTIINNLVNAIKNLINTHTHSSLAITAEIPANSNLNDYTTAGNYTCSQNNSATLQNKPFSGSYYCLVENKEHSSGRMIQLVYLLTSTKNLSAIYYRVLTFGGWSEWVLIAGTRWIDSNTDLDDYTIPGKYVSTTSNVSKTLDNTPWGDKSSNSVAFALRVLESFYSNQKYGYVQILYPYPLAQAGIIYKRNFYDNAWSNWYKLEMTSV